MRARAGRLLANGQVRFGAVLVVTLFVLSVVVPWLSPHDATTSHFERAGEGPMAPSLTFPLGGDRLFRDELVRLAYGGRTSLLIGVAATTLATVVGTAVGIVAGYYEGARGLRVPWLVVAVAVLAAGLGVYGPARAGALLVSYGGLPLLALALVAFALAKVAKHESGPELGLDAVLMRVVDIGLAFPFLLLVMALGSAFERTSATTILLTLGFSGWLGIARVVRAKTIGIRNQEYVLAARALGQTTPRILALHVLPNVLGPVVVLSTLSVAQMIVAESAMSYLGVGISPPEPTWGYMLFEGQETYATAPWLLAAPFGAILVAVLGFNVLGEGLREALDPRKERR